MIRSIAPKVESRCATQMTVRLSANCSVTCCTSASARESNDAVGSFSTSIRPFRTKARAITSRWRCPPESVTPRSPTRVA